MLCTAIEVLINHRIATIKYKIKSNQEPGTAKRIQLELYLLEVGQHRQMLKRLLSG